MFRICLLALPFAAGAIAGWFIVHAGFWPSVAMLAVAAAWFAYLGISRIGRRRAKSC